MFLLAALALDVEDAKASEKTVVYTKYIDGNTNGYFGSGTKTDPYNQFRDAVDNVADGGTIYIIGAGFLNDKAGQGGAPLVINKNITIKSDSETNYAKLSIRPAGLLLGADVRFENIQLEFANKTHDSIFANGHKLELINVSNSSGGRVIDLFAGGLNSESGGNGQIVMKRDANFSDSQNSETYFGNIYAGSMNSPFQGNAIIDIDGNGKIKYGNIYASGAHEADPGGLFDIEEPEPPEADPQAYPIEGDVKISVNKPSSLSEIHGEGAVGDVTVSVHTQNPITPVMTEIDNLMIASGEIYGEKIEKLTGNLVLGETGILNLTKHPASGFCIDGNFQGMGGRVRLKKDGTVDIGGTISGECRIQTQGYPMSGDESGAVKEGHVYFSAGVKSGNTEILFTPNQYTSQKDWKLYIEKIGNKIVWKAGKPSDGAAMLTSLKIVPAEQTMTVKEFWENNAEFELEYEGNETALDSLEHQINGKEPEECGIELFNFGSTLYAQQLEDVENYCEPGVYTLTVSHPESGITSSVKLILKTEFQPGPEPEPEPSVTPPTEPPKPVTPPVSQKVTDVKLNYSSLSMQNGKSAVLRAQVTPSNAANKKLSWSSSDSGVAVVNQDGTVTAKAPGTAVITATSVDGSGKYAQCRVTVGYKVTYYLNGGKNHSSNKAVYYGKSVSLRSPSRKGYSFGGWYTDRKYKKRIKTLSGKTAKNYTVYAKWQKVKTGKTAFTSVKSSKRGQVYAIYKKVSGAKGYELTYSTHAKFKKSAMKSVRTKSVRYTLKKLKRGKTYYVKVRAYKEDSAGKRVYGSYSKVKKIKVR